MAIHPTAIISPNAELDSSVEVGPHAIIEEHVKIGAGTQIGANTYLTGYTEIGRENQIHLGAVIGHEPQDLKFDRTCRSYLRIGDRNIFREYATVHRGTAPESATIIGDECFLMAGMHVGHNCIIGNNVIVANSALLAGHVHVGDRAFISGGAAIHQFMHVGRLSIISGNSSISMDVPPFTMAAERNEVFALNLVGLRRAKLPETTIAELKKLFRLYYRSGLNGTQARAAAAQAGIFTSPEAEEFIEFFRTSPNGVCPGARR
ncbi:MAG: Acyl-[acyl-carrier-protein]--UDP-N-acetylglucosamine O-acyltransferase [Verrucomicrobiae bacterium]|nr:Acyl-[acyl-carrier-protein]--UDP-N-acetylglucosamine O-acyltransferase [Verrucomicrobiae bacterium]